MSSKGKAQGSHAPKAAKQGAVRRAAPNLRGLRVRSSSNSSMSSTAPTPYRRAAAEPAAEPASEPAAEPADDDDVASNFQTAVHYRSDKPASLPAARQRRPQAKK